MARESAHGPSHQRLATDGAARPIREALQRAFSPWHTRSVARESYFLVYFHSEIALAEATRALQSRTWVETIPTDAGVLQVRAASETAASSEGRALRPVLTVWLSTEPHVQLEAREQAEEHEVPELAACRWRFEVSFDDLDEVLDETNTLFEVQATLQDLTTGYVVNAWNGALTLPGGEPCSCSRCASW